VGAVVQLQLVVLVEAKRVGLVRFDEVGDDTRALLEPELPRHLNAEPVDGVGGERSRLDARRAAIARPDPVLDGCPADVADRELGGLRRILRERRRSEAEVTECQDPRQPADSVAATPQHQM
jgi:hypothetical protein